MARKRSRPLGKTRTREHVIADLGINHVERQLLLCGFSAERIEHDYGTDLILFTYNDEGEIENGEVRLQVKATDRLKMHARQPAVSFRVERADLQSWLREPMPVILVVYDSRAERAHWLYVQEYFESQRDFKVSRAPRSITVTIPRSHILDPGAVRRFASFRDRVLAQMKGVIRHHG